MKFQVSKGFTLIEVLIAIFVLAVGVVGVLQAFPLGTHIAKSSQMLTTATQLSQAKIEEAISKSYGELIPATTTENYGEISGFNSYKRVTKISCVHFLYLSEEPCDYDLTNDPYPMKKIEVMIFWKTPLGVTEKETKVTTLISKR